LQTRANKQSFPSADDEQSQYSNPVLPTGESLGIDALHFSPFPRHLWAKKTSPTEPALNNVSQRCQRHGHLPVLRKFGEVCVCVQWRQREYNFGGDAEGIKEQLQGTRKTVSLLDDNVGAIESVVTPCEVCAKPSELGFNENSCENGDDCG